jgi:transcriptional regulator GlxA family with amidase domain
MDLRTEYSGPRSKLKEWPTRRIAFLVLSNTHLTSLAGPLDVFTRASALLTRSGKRRSPAYAVELLTADENPLITESGLGVIGGRRWSEVDHSIDTLLVLASANVAQARIDPELLAWIRARTPQVRRIGSVCSGAFVLAAAGVLDGRQATTHWELAGVLAARYPRISVDGDRIFTQDGNVWTSAGVSTGIDLALALVEEDHGHALALEIARRLVLFMRRGGGQSQFSSQLAGQAADHQPIRELIAWVSEHLDADLSVPALARRVGMSGRNFSRVFTQQVSSTPARFIARLRAEAAHAKLAATPEKLEAIAQSSGFGDKETLRRHLRDDLGVSFSSERSRAALRSASA